MGVDKSIAIDAMKSIKLIDLEGKALTRRNLLSELYGRVIPASLAKKVCFPEDGKHHHLWYEVKSVTHTGRAYETRLELNCGCGKVIAYGSQYYSELLLGLIESMAEAKDEDVLKYIKATVPERVIQDAWKLASDKVKKHCYQLCSK